MILKILRPENVDQILNFEMARLEKEISDPNDRQFASWQAKWRKEALEFYLPLGWSFVAFDGSNNILGYFLGQPLLFFQGLTQVLWIETLTAVNDDVSSELVDTAYKWARDKHLQKVVFADAEKLKNSFRSLKVEHVGLALSEIKTTRY